MEAEKKIVVYLDILGFKQLELSTKIKILEYIPNSIQFDIERTDVPLQHQKQPLDCTVYIVSDSIIITLEDLDKWQNLFDRLVQLQYDLFVRFSILIRGAITYGEVIEYFQTSPLQLRVVGKAYEKAYELSEGSLKPSIPVIQIDQDCMKSYPKSKTNGQIIHFFSPDLLVNNDCIEREVVDSDGYNSRISDFGSLLGLNWIRRSLIKDAAGSLNLLIPDNLIDGSVDIPLEEIKECDLTSLIQKIKFTEELNFIHSYIALLNDFFTSKDSVKIKYRWVIRETLKCLCWHMSSWENLYENDAENFYQNSPKNYLYCFLLELLIRKSLHVLNDKTSIIK